MRARVSSGIALSLVVAVVVAVVVAFGAAGCSLQIDEREFNPSVDADTTDSIPAGIELTPDPLVVTEGETAVLTVRALAALSSDVTVTLAADPTVGLSASSVVLSPSAPEAAVTVTALDDDDVRDDDATVTATTDLGFVTATIDVVEDDELQFDVDQPALTVTELTDTVLNVRLTAEPSGNLTVGVESGDTSIASVSTGTILFDADNWNVYQPITVAGSHDPDTMDDTAPIRLRATGLDPLDVIATVNDVDRLAIETSVGTINVTEQGPSVTISVRLTQQPANNVLVAAASGSANVRVDPSSVTFTPQNYSAFQPLTITALGDEDTAGFTTTVTLSTTEPDVSDIPFSVVVTDDDMQAITHDAPVPLVLDEGEGVAFNARLAYQPTENVVVGVSSSDTAAVTVVPGALTFTPTNWNQTQVVSVTGVDDPNVVTNTATVRLQASPLLTNVAVEVLDLDLQDLVLANAPTVVTEGSTATFTVRLAYEPAAPTVVTVGSSDAAIAVSAGASLTFTPANYATPQMVTLSAPNDIDVVEESATITVQTTGLPARTFSVAVDETSVIAIQPSTSSVTVVEQAAGQPFTVTLSNPPVGTMVVNISSSDAGVSFSPPSLSFTAASYMTPQTVTVSGVGDDDVAGISANLTLAATGATSALVGVVVMEDDVQSIVENAANPLAVGEGASTTFGVRLAFRPAASTVVFVSSMATGVATVAPGSLTFTTANWDQFQTVTVSGVEDIDVAGNAATVRLQSGTFITDVPVSVGDNDTQDIVLASTPATITEGGTATFTVRLAYQPAANTVVSIGSSDAAVGVMTPSVTFTPANYATPQTVTLNAPADVDVIAETSTITASSPGLTSRSFNVTVNETSVIQILPSTSSLSVTEQAAGQPFTVTLSNPPASSMTVNIASSDAGVTFMPASLTFTTASYMTPQTVTVSGVSDDDVAAGGATLTLSATGATSGTVTVTVVEDDVQSIVENAANPLVVGEGASATFGVRLAFRPGASVMVGVSSLGTGVATVSPASLTFTTANWDQLQTVTVSGVEDVDVALSSTTVRLQSGVMTTDVATNVTDNDTQDITLASIPTTISEGGTASFTARLAYQPAANTVVSIASSDAAVGVTTTSVTFTPANYATPQPVTLNAPVDIDVIDETSTITVSSTGLPSKTFNISVDDLTEITILTSAPTVNVTEEAAGQSFTVTLSNPPASNLTVAVNSSSPGVTRSPTSLVFTSANYNSPQSVTLAAAADDDCGAGSATITLSATGATSATVAVNVADNDTQAIIESAPATVDLTDPDGSSPAGVAFGVRLACQPAGNVTVTATSLATGTATVSPGSLLFTPSDWNGEKNVTATAVADANLADGSTTIRLSSSGLSNVDVPVAVDDQDVQVVETNPASTLTVTEGMSAPLQVRLKYQPAATTSVTLSSSSTEVTVPATLSFTTANYNMYQNATVAAVPDADAANDTATITLGNFDAPSNATVGVTVTDNTVIESWGWPNQFSPSGTQVLNSGLVFAHRISVTQAATLDRFGVFMAADTNTFKLALYTDAGNVPGTLVASFETPTQSATGRVEVDVPNQPIAAGNYWLAIRTNAATVVHSASNPTATLCTRNVSVTYTNAWPATWGTTSCSTNTIFNYYITTFR